MIDVKDSSVIIMKLYSEVKIKNDIHKNPNIGMLLENVDSNF